MKVFFQNIADELEIPLESPLPCSFGQAIDIFHSMPDYDGSHIGFLTDKGTYLQVTKYDRFLFLIDIMDFENHQSHETLMHYQQVYQLIKDLFEGFDPYALPNLELRNW
ncbi:hypothetical protein QP519_03285 [Weeksella virosa]|uniref:hypothetical protein n=1 Tax=Weeksella virosa TaxID=1014 RepID=UPI000DFD7719|nr:hypothetical protein [Weeksella virosa]MDK7374558.1 hypothetical protein [Weeksella virosa]MDK7674708.1 hypothetical protein [Weeksella virosa]SUP54653.1 Uncharacterised protein [Weeksella virosa]